MFGEQYTFENREGRSVLIHKPTEIAFVEVPAGTFTFGFSNDHMTKAAAIDLENNLELYLEVFYPSEQVTLAEPIWVSETPITELNLIKSACDPSVPTYKTFHDSVSCITFDIASDFCNKNGFRMLTEREWEYCMRGGSTSLFVWGDELLADEELEAWMDLGTSETSAVPSNGFGLKCLFAGDGTADRWTTPSQPGTEDLGRVIKSGAAYLWPWDGNDWIFAIPHMRCQEKGIGIEKFAFRVALI
jgi:formylglycine-generating enzyme required for sulfatase activity